MFTVHENDHRSLRLTLSLGVAKSAEHRYSLPVVRFTFNIFLIAIPKHMFARCISNLRSYESINKLI